MCLKGATVKPKSCQRKISLVIALNVVVKSAVCLICKKKTGKLMISIFKLIIVMPNSVETFTTIELNRKKTKVLKYFLWIVVYFG